jgi:hypothetical protein
MKNSIFGKIYSYRERENQNAKENFLTEIFGYCLQTDTSFFHKFLNLLSIAIESDYSVKTQQVYDYGRPDLEINLKKSNTCILIECKIEHFERENQLEDYKSVLLEKKVNQRHLVYLTKYYEYRENKNSKICLSLLRWSDIYNIINEYDNQITQELKNFLKEENMSDTKNFNYGDIITLMNITDTVSKMDEVIDSVKKYFENNIGSLSKDSSRSTRIIDSWYVAYHLIVKPTFKYSIDMGFMWWDEDVFVGLRIYIYKADKYKESDKILLFFKKYLKGWSFDDCDNAYTFEKVKRISEFIISEDEQLPQIRDFLITQIDELTSLKNNHPTNFE